MSDPKYYSIFQKSQTNGLRLPITVVPAQQRPNEHENKKANKRKSDDVVIIEDELPEISLEPFNLLNEPSNIKVESILDQIIPTKEEFEENEDVFNYTQENDTTLNSDSENENEPRIIENFDPEKFIIKDTQVVQVKSESLDKDEDEEDEDDEDIKLIWDSKELLDQIDGRLKMICVDLTSDNEEVDDKEKVKKIINDTSPIVINEKTGNLNNKNHTGKICFLQIFLNRVKKLTFIKIKF